MAGWDFFDDDNDPFDASSCCSATDHGTGRATEAGADTNNAEAGASLCPECQIMPMRVWDTFVVDTNLFALGTAYAADNGAEVVEGAVGGLLNSNFARRMFRYADRKGVTLTLVSSDLNTADHNYPTNYNEAIYVGGTLPDTAPNETCEGPSLPGVAAPEPPSGGGFTAGCNAFLAALGRASGGTVVPSAQPPTTSFFRNSNLTQYGGKADIVLVGATGSENTGQAAGAAGLLESYARERFTGSRRQLSNNEVRQLLTMSAEDVRPLNTGQIGQADKAEVGWDPHFGYGRVNLAGAMRMIQAGRIPPETQLDGPDWFAPINLARVGSGGVPISGRIAAPHSDAGPGAWSVQFACGQDAPDSAFRPTGIAGSGARNGRLGSLSKGLLQRLANSCNGEVRNDAGRPAGRASDGAWPADPYPNPDPERKAFQIRLVVSERGDAANRGVYRKTLFAYNDDGNLKGFPRPVGAGSQAGALITGSGGEASPRLVDLDADNKLEFLQPTSSGELSALRADGSASPSFNGGKPVRTDPYPVSARHPAPGGQARPNEPLRTPAVGDVTGDGEPEVVATAGEHVYAWDRRGRRLFKRRIDPRLSEPCRGGPAAKPCFAPAARAIDRSNHIKRGFIGSAALADLNGDRRLDIVAGSLDQHVYALDGRGRSLPGFPRKLSSPGATSGAEIVTSPAIAELDGDPRPEVVLATNEVLAASNRPPPAGELSGGSFFGAFLTAAAGSSVVYAINHDGSKVAGSWPAKLGALLPDILPLVGPGHDAAVLDVDRDGRDEVSVSATTAEAQLLRSDGSTRRTYQGGSPADAADPARQFNLFEYSVVGDVLGAGRPSVFKGGISTNGVVNLAAPNQNFAFNHTVQGWDPESGAQLPGFPRATDDFQLLSQPAVAKVGGAGRERQALTGTGLYQLHAYGPGGNEPSGWPKFAGGWLFATPSVGDLDGDQKLDVAALTREGFSFAWKTGMPACTGAAGSTTNNEWWTFHHDEFGTANYRTDSRPPSRPPAGIERVAAPGADLLAFKASGDDGPCGRAARYEVRGSDEPITDGGDFVNTTPLVVRDESSGGQARLRVEDARRFRFLAVRAVDDRANASYVRATGARGPSGRGTDGDDVIVGSARADRIDCGSGNDWVDSGGGDDVIRCGSGNDLVEAGPGDDIVHGDSGNDRIDGGTGDDGLFGGTGDDRIVGGPGRDRIDGGSGRNSVSQ